MSACGYAERGKLFEQTQAIVHGRRNRREDVDHAHRSSKESDEVDQCFLREGDARFHGCLRVRLNQLLAGGDSE
jgi:hypothetical protein